MGLSDEERQKNIIHIVNELSKIKSFKHYELKEFNSILKNIWYSLLKNEGDSSFWIVGSSLTHDKISMNSLFGNAIINSASHNQKIDDDSLDEQDKEYYDYIDNYLPTAISILKKSSHYNGESYLIFEIFILVENYFYNANRYPNDKLSKKVKYLTKQMSKLHGLCYRIICDSEIFSKAYMIGIIFQQSIITNNKNDLINKWFMENNIHHSISLNKISFNDLFETFKKVQIRSLNTTERLEFIMKSSGYDYYEDIFHKKLISIIKLHNKSSKEKINLNNINKIIKKNQENKKNKEKNNYNWSCDLTLQNSYKSK